MKKSYQWAAPGDVNSFFGLVLDNLANLVLIVTLLAYVFEFPTIFILQYMIPGTALGVLVGDALYCFSAFRLAKRTGRTDVTAMPLGLDTPSVFGIVLFVLGPAFVAKKTILAGSDTLTEDQIAFEAALYAWRIGIWTMVISGVFKLICSLCANSVRRFVPRAGLLGSLMAIALAMIAFLPVVDSPLKSFRDEKKHFPVNHLLEKNVIKMKAATPNGIENVMDTDKNTKLRIIATEPDDWSDEQLLRQYCHSEDAVLFERLVSRYRRELFHYLQRYLGNAAAAEDVFQTTFLQVHLKRDAFDQERRFRPWLYTIATRQAIDYQRYESRRNRATSLDAVGSGAGEDGSSLASTIPGNEPTPAARMLNAEQQDWVREALTDLPEILRSAVVMVYFQGMQYQEAAEALEVPIGTVKSRVHSAVNRLGEAWNRAA